MKPFIYFSGLLLLASLATARGGDALNAPSSATSATFDAVRLPASEVPPVTAVEAGGSGTATLTFDLTRDSGQLTPAQ